MKFGVEKAKSGNPERVEQASNYEWLKFNPFRVAIFLCFLPRISFGATHVQPFQGFDRINLLYDPQNLHRFFTESKILKNHHLS
jgi:hypothetical protein